MKGIIRISALLWAEILVLYALFVLQKYLTEVWKLSFTHAAGILNIWGGIAFILPVGFLYLVDSVLGNYTMLALSSVAFSTGIGFIAISTPPILANPCKKFEPKCIGLPEKVVFYTGMVLLAIGVAGHIVSLKPFYEQKDKPANEDEGKKSKLSLFTLFILVPVIGGYFLGKIKQWSILFGIPAICSAVATIAFLSGWRKYDKAELQRSPLTNICRVFVASARKRSVKFDPELVRTENNSEPKPLSGTGFLGCLDKAAMETSDIRDEDIWQLCKVSEVEEAKIVVCMLPICTTFIVCGIVSSIGNTYFAEQANHMSHRINKHKIPTQVLLMLFEWAKSLFSRISKKPKHERCYPPTMGIGIAMVFSVLCCVTAARIETIRLNIIRDRGLFDKTGDEIPMSMFWLVFQFILLGGLDSFMEDCVAAFFEEEAPKSMRNYMNYFAKGMSGLGFMCGVLSVYVVGKISKSLSGKSWFQFSLNKSRLDKYYWVLACLSFVNLLVFIAMASSYRYKKKGEKEKYKEEDTEVS